jgi:hypothetical protein
VRIPFHVQVERATERSPGAIREGSYTLTDNIVRVYDQNGRLVGSGTLAPDAEALARAKQILREKEDRNAFYAPIAYPKQGIV